MQAGRVYGDISPQLVHGQALHQRVGIRFGHVQQNAVPVGGQEEIGDEFALGRQDRGIDRGLIQLADIVGHKALQKLAGVGA